MDQIIYAVMCNIVELRGIFFTRSVNYSDVSRHLSGHTKVYPKLRLCRTQRNVKYPRATSQNL